MKKVIIVVLMFVGITTFAQEKKQARAEKEKMTAEQKVNMKVEKLASDLALNDKQIKQVKLLMEIEIKKHEEKKAELSGLREKKNEERKAVMEKKKAEMKEEQAQISNEMKAILTAEQFSKWEKMKEEKRSKMKDRMVERREKREQKK